MNYLGIDYGQKKVGLALGTQTLAEPYRVIRYQDKESLITTLKKIIKDEGIEKVIVGVSENKMAKESKEFAKIIGAGIFDETLTTHDAIKLSIQGGVKRKRRKEMEDAYAATIMLQNYLDKQ
jgi:putative Holliday junction resolvase